MAARSQLEASLRRTASDLAGAQKRRDQLMVQASEAGMTLKEIAAIVGLSFGRVGQIVRAQRH